MLNDQERTLIYNRAYIPEHLPDYVEAISATEAHLHDTCICYTGQRHLIFVGYPLDDKEGDIAPVYESALKRFKPATVSIIAPRLCFGSHVKEHEHDDYYRLELPCASMSSGVSYMVRRAARELSVTVGRFGSEHAGLIGDFIGTRDIRPGHKEIFSRLHRYMEQSGHARLLEARKANGTLSAITIVDTGSAHYAFYLFNFRSPGEEIPGVSDLLFHEMVRLSEREGKGAINLGLGINEGNRRFKEKWGGTTFLPCISTTVGRHPPVLETLLNKL